MLRIRASWIYVSAVVLLVATVMAQNDEPIQLGRFEVHPYRIIAKHASPDQAVSASTKATLQQMGLRVHRRYALVPGSVVFDTRPAVSVKTAAGTDPKVLADNLAARIAVLRDSGLFSYVGPDYLVKPLITEPADARFRDGTLWGLRNTGQNGGVAGADVIADPDGSSTNAWDITTGSKDVIVAVVDTGVRYTHQDLARQMWVNTKEVPGNGVDDDGNGYVDDVYGINALAGSGDPWDDQGHGTHVAGTIGAAANDGYPHVGVAWNVRLMACKFLGAFGGFNSDAIESINYAVANGARVINASYGGGAFDEVERDAIFAASTNGVLFVAAAGNESTENDLIPAFPASYDVENIISVAALDRKDKLAWFSNFGRTTVHLGAPGTEIFSSWNGSDSDYNTIEGTSMASPHVAGVAALILGANPGASMVEMRERILRTTVPVEDLANRTLTGGRVNAYRALMAKSDTLMEMLFSPRTNSAVLISTNFTIQLTLSDLFPITNATVTGEVLGSSNITGSTNLLIPFLNDGVLPDVRTNDNVYTAVVDVTPFMDPPLSGILTLQVVGLATNDFPVPGSVSRGTNTVVYYLVDRPPNDSFAGADKVLPEGAFGDGIILATNTYATLETGEPVHAGVSKVSSSLWWNWSPASDSRALVDTAGSSFDTVLAVYTGDRLDRLTKVASAAGGVQRRVSLQFDAKRGGTYRIAVAGTDTNQIGNIRLRIQPDGRPDRIAPVAAISSPLNGTTYAVSRIDVSGTAYDPEPDASGVKQVFVSVNGAIGSATRGTTNWTATAVLLPGANTLEVYAGDNADNVSSRTKVTVFYSPVESPNDIFGTILDVANPFFLKVNSGTSTTTNAAASKEFNEPFHAGNQGGRSVWWSWRAPADGVLTLDTRGSSYDTLLAVYTGNRVYSLSEVLSNDDAAQNTRTSKLLAGVRSNVVYRIAVDGFAGASGSTVLNYEFGPTNLVLLTVAATEGGSVSPSAGTIAVQVGSLQTIRATPSPYFDFTGWGGDLVASVNPVTFPVASNMTVHAVFKAHVFAEDFESGGFGGLNWQSGGSLPWTVTDESAFLGTYSAKSGAISHNQTSSMLLTTNFMGGTGRFYFRVSSEEGWDTLKFFVDGTLLGTWSGLTEWASFEFPVSAGLHTLEWRYQKDLAGSIGQDAAFVDAIDLPIKQPADPSVPAVLAIDRLFNGVLELRLNGQTNQVYVLQSSTSLQGWKSFSTNVANHGEIRIPLPRSASAQFYRAFVK